MGIRIRGTLIFNFGPSWDASEKFQNEVAVYINSANLTAGDPNSGLDPSNPATHTTGYPPTFSDSSKAPWNVDITGQGFENFAPDDDLPALMYNTGIFDFHGPGNVCGVVYSPSFMEIENKLPNQTQYFNGAIIGGGGIYVQNEQSSARTLITYDPNTINKLATMNNKGKSMMTTFWE